MMDGECVCNETGNFVEENGSCVCDYNKYYILENDECVCSSAGNFV